ncbi:outer membrane beta-barrel protein [Algoriphagus aquimarinus]|uniref:Outer membrane beta-barrel protein n=1 Tax=Algoriphagus aquimarinus TaxID=237018 RepID=A0A5C7ARG3_9BACT|nr:outer membrane beta-barrel protein [Algoriphagus aquimarinus]TXE11240.1 outer membrane beta-barrel protein [Algoriphagus aquimarinus]
MSRKSQLLILVCLLFGSMNLSAQSFYKEKQSRDNIFSIGVGPAMAYMDNGGQYSTFHFEVKPSVTASLIKRLNDRFDLRASAGMQWISSGGNPTPNITGLWFEKHSAFTVSGPVYYFDLMPSMYVVPFGNHMNRSLFNFYGGVGLGVMHASTEQTKTFDRDEIPTHHTITTGYVPIRAGLSYSIGPFSDIALEGSLMMTFTDNLDGNVDFNRFGDHLGQAQVVYRRYFFSNKD